MKEKYLNNTKWICNYRDEENSIQINDNKPNVITVENGIVLPTKHSRELSWGLGGVVNAKHEFVPESGIPTAFGGAYLFDDNDLETYDETVVFVGIIPKHIGHFLIDAVSRYWYLLEQDTEELRIAFCSYEWDDMPISDKYGEVFDLLNISKKRLIHIKKPSKFNRVIIPEPTMTFGNSCSEEYKKVISHLITASNTISQKKGLNYYDKMEMSRNVQSGNTQNLKSTVVQRSFPKWSVAERRKTAAASDQAAICACAHSRYFTGGSPSGLRV